VRLASQEADLLTGQCRLIGRAQQPNLAMRPSTRAALASVMEKQCPGALRQIRERSGERFRVQSGVAFESCPVCRKCRKLRHKPAFPDEVFQERYLRLAAPSLFRAGRRPAAFGSGDVVTIDAGSILP